MRIPGSTFVISGGASGLGLETTLSLHNSGANVVILDRNEEDGKALAKDLGSTALFVKVDVTDENEVESAISKAVETFGSIQGCINCAGIATAYKLVNPKGTSMPTSIFETTIKINLIGTFIVSKVCAQQMALQELKDEKERGVIILTGSIAAYEGQQGQIGYSASKGGVISMTLPMSRELAPYGIRIMSIAPGVFETPMSSLMSKKVRTALEQDCVFPKRLGNPIEFALLVASIIENPMLNGSTIRLDGASRLSKL